MYLYMISPHHNNIRINDKKEMCRLCLLKKRTRDFFYLTHLIMIKRKKFARRCRSFTQN
jgi:hypothetical protein